MFAIKEQIILVVVQIATLVECVMCRETEVGIG